jgi:hypothetical protein
MDETPQLYAEMWKYWAAIYLMAAIEIRTEG